MVSAGFGKTRVRDEVKITHVLYRSLEQIIILWDQERIGMVRDLIQCHAIQNFRPQWTPGFRIRALSAILKQTYLGQGEDEI